MSSIAFLRATVRPNFLEAPLVSRAPKQDRVLKVFQRASLNLQSEKPSLAASGEVVSLSNLWKNPFEIFMAGLWGILWADSLGSVVMSGIQLHKQQTISSSPVLRQGPASSKEERDFFFKSVSFVGVTANIATWANEIKAIALGGSAFGVKCVGYGASCITNSIQAYKSCEEIFEQAKQLKHASGEVESVLLRKKQLLSSMDLAAYATGGIWALLELSGLVLGMFFPPALLTTLLILSCVLAISAIFYRVHLWNQHPNILK